MTKTLPQKKYRRYRHTGKFEMNKFEGRECWSCCMNYELESEGCNAMLVDPEKWNLQSY